MSAPEHVYPDRLPVHATDESFWHVLAAEPSVQHELPSRKSCGHVMAELIDCGESTPRHRYPVLLAPQPTLGSRSQTVGVPASGVPSFVQNPSKLPEMSMGVVVPSLFTFVPCSIAVAEANATPCSSLNVYDVTVNEPHVWGAAAVAMDPETVHFSAQSSSWIFEVDDSVPSEFLVKTIFVESWKPLLVV